MKRLLLVLLAIVWFVGVLYVTWRVTFPSEVVAENIKWQVYRLSDEEFFVELSDVKPWGLGLSAKNVRIFEVMGYRDPRTELRFAMEAARLRVYPGSLLARAPVVSGRVQLGSGLVDLKVGTSISDGMVAVTSAELEADSFPLAEIAALAGGEIGGAGGLDIEVDIEAPDGMDSAEGKVVIQSSDIVVNTISIPGLLDELNLDDLGMALVIDEIDLDFDVDEGEAKIDRGLLRAPGKADIELEGSITLKDDIMRSTLRLDAVLDISEEMAMVKGFLSDAEWDDGKYHYSITGSIGRPSLKAAREGTSSSSSSSASTRRERTPEEEAERNAARDERRRRREEIREQLRTEGLKDGDDLEDEEREHRRPEEDDFDDEEYEDDEEGFEDDEDGRERDELGDDEPLPEEF
ncbi:MAG: type II secretion system protein GspN [Proteobacteria bacterium]|jgi:type II secretion system protein N|nr:type II secretion system protein GspN [Pseudomonadota bacterium]